VFIQDFPPHSVYKYKRTHRSLRHTLGLNGRPRPQCGAAWSTKHNALILLYLFKISSAFTRRCLIFGWLEGLEELEDIDDDRTSLKIRAATLFSELGDLHDKTSAGRWDLLLFKAIVNKTLYFPRGFCLF
jgi:hypothetical protein